MKLTEAQKKSLALFLTKGEANLTAEEKTEFTKLKGIAADEAKEVGKSVDAFLDDIKALHVEDDNDDDDQIVTEKELQEIVTNAVKAASADAKNVDTDKLVADIKKSFEDNGKMDETKMVELIKKATGDNTALVRNIVEQVKAAIPAATPAGITEKQLNAILEKFATSIKTPSRMEHEDNAHARDFPIEHRDGNLTVGQKQLVNLCLMSVSRDAQSKSAEIPTDINHGIPESALRHAQQVGERHIKALRQQVKYKGAKALTTTGTNSGAELIPSDLSGELSHRMYLESAVAAEFMAQEIDMPTNPFSFPLITGRSQFYVGSEAPGSDPTASNPPTGDFTLNAKKLIGMAEFSYETDEDGIIAMLPMLQDNLAKGAADAFEGAIINGDTTATHMDSDIHAVTNHSSKLFKGLRKLALAGGVTLDMSTGGIAFSNLQALRKKLKRFGVKPQDLMWITGPQGYSDFVGLDETLTFDKVGNANAARILTGEAASVAGIRIVVSSQVREDLNAAGVYDGCVDTKSSLLLVYKPAWVVGVKRGFTVEVDVDKKRQINSVVASFRRDFVPKETVSASLPFVGLGYNFATV